MKYLISALIFLLFAGQNLASQIPGVSSEPDPRQGQVPQQTEGSIPILPDINAKPPEKPAAAQEAQPRSAPRINPRTPAPRPESDTAPSTASSTAEGESSPSPPKISAVPGDEELRRIPHKADGPTLKEIIEGHRSRLRDVPWMFSFGLSWSWYPQYSLTPLLNEPGSPLLYAFVNATSPISNVRLDSAFSLGLWLGHESISPRLMFRVLLNLGFLPARSVLGADIGLQVFNSNNGFVELSLRFSWNSTLSLNLLGINVSSYTDLYLGPILRIGMANGFYMQLGANFNLLGNQPQNYRLMIPLGIGLYF